jgi:hypothetical protein
MTSLKIVRRGAIATEVYPKIQRKETKIMRDLSINSFFVARRLCHPLFSFIARISVGSEWRTRLTSEALFVWSISDNTV